MKKVTQSTIDKERRKVIRRRECGLKVLGDNSIFFISGV